MMNSMFMDDKNDVCSIVCSLGQMGSVGATDLITSKILLTILIKYPVPSFPCCPIKGTHSFGKDTQLETMKDIDDSNSHNVQTEGGRHWEYEIKSSNLDIQIG